MATENNVHIPDDLLAELRAKAAVEGKSVDQLAEAILRKGLEDLRWEGLIEYGERRGRALGFPEEEAGDMVHD
jgi:plasmid stability protein